MGLPVDQLIVLEGIPASKQAEGSYMKHNIIITKLTMLLVLCITYRMQGELRN